MANQPPLNLSRRERQIMEIIYQLGEATAADVHERMPDPPSYTTVRGLLRTLESKGHVAHGRDGARYVYRPRLARETAGRSVLQHVVRTFFQGSAAKAMAALVGSSSRLSEADLDRLTRVIEDARARGPRR
jgi:predicted transcriptional regulator